MKTKTLDRRTEPSHQAGVSLSAVDARALRRFVAARGYAGAAIELGCSVTLIEKLEYGGAARADSVARVVASLPTPAAQAPLETP